MPKTLRESLSTRHNALNFVRLTLAFVVIFGHAWPLGGFEGWTLDLGGWAVQGFFAISGYLIAGSRMRLGIREYLASRALRIFPAYWSVLILTAFALALAIGENYEPSSALSCVISNAGLYQAQWAIDDTLVSVPVAIAWNGSLWSLFPEFLAYVGAALLLTLPWARRHATSVTATAFVGLVAFQPLALGPMAVSTELYLHLIRLGTFFLAGMLLYFVGDQLVLRRRYGFAAIGVFVVLVAVGLGEAVGQLPFVFVLLLLGATLPVRIGSENDISYGLYIWAFPVQQVLAALGTSWLGPIGSIFVATLVTAGIAWLSWRYIERPAMRLRRFVPASWHTPKPSDSTSAVVG